MVSFSVACNSAPYKDLAVPAHSSQGCPLRRMGSPGLWTAWARLDIVAVMQLLSGKDAADHIAGIIHPKYQVHGFSVHLTVRKIYAVDPIGKLDFGGGEYVPAGRVEIAARQLRPDDNYLWWELDRDTYFVECNETMSLASDQIALIEPEDRLLRAGGWHAPLFVRGHVDPVELLLTVGVLQLRVKENARIARVRLFCINEMVRSARISRKSGPPKRSRSKRK